MKRKKYYYTQNKHLAPNRTIDNWIKCKDRFWKWVTTDYIQGVFGIELRPKHRHRRTWAGRNRFKIWGHESIKTVLYSRPAKPIGRKKHNKWLYMPKRVLI